MYCTTELSAIKFISRITSSKRQKGVFTCAWINIKHDSCDVSIYGFILTKVCGWVIESNRYINIYAIRNECLTEAYGSIKLRKHQVAVNVVEGDICIMK